LVKVFLPLDLGPEFLHQADDLVDHPVDRSVHRRDDLLEDLLDLAGDAADAQDRGQAPMQDRDGAGQGAFDQAGTPPLPPLAIAMTASRTALTNSMIWRAWVTMKRTMSMIILQARMNADAGLNSESDPRDPGDG
jgi:hypothetical protein